MKKKNPTTALDYIMIGTLILLVLMLGLTAYQMEKKNVNSLPELLGEKVREFKEEFNEGYNKDVDTVRIDTTEKDSVNLDTRPMGL